MSNLKILGIGNALVDIMVLVEDHQIINYLKLPKGGMTLVMKDILIGLSDGMGDYLVADKTSIHKKILRFA